MLILIMITILKITRLKCSLYVVPAYILFNSLLIVSYTKLTFNKLQVLYQIWHVKLMSHTVERYFYIYYSNCKLSADVKLAWNLIWRFSKLQKYAKFNTTNFRIVGKALGKAIICQSLIKGLFSNLNSW